MKEKIRTHQGEIVREGTEKVGSNHGGASA